MMDNLSSHKTSGVREAIEAVHASLLYLPPHSPDFNRSSRSGPRSYNRCEAQPRETAVLCSKPSAMRHALLRSKNAEDSPGGAEIPLHNK
ncbi:MAG: transposase [Planctomycetes bacterium]|nr:transposase [Planctomycetota bacterium]